MSATVLTNSPVWTAAGWTMIHAVWVGLAIGLMAALTRRLLRSAGPDVRYGVALAWLMVLSVSPALIFVWVFEPDSRTEIATIQAVQTSHTASSGSSVISELPRLEFRGAVADRPTSDLKRSRLDFLVPYLPWSWLAGSLSTLVMLATGLVGVEQLRRTSRLVEVGDLSTRCRVLADSLGIVRRVSIGICDRLRGPILVGVIRPMILLPPAALSGWSAEQIEMVLLHELAHLRRWDNLVNLAQRVIESILFFQPVVWWMSGWVRLERELCCDRLVVERLGRPFAYAEMLMTVSGSSRTGRRAALAMADRQVMTRIRRLLNLEDRSMKLTMPEGLGVLFAVIVGMSLALGLQAAPPKPAGDSEESIRQTLRNMVDDVAKETSRDLREDASSMMTLINIADAQIKLGDRVSALVTLQRSSESFDHIDPKKGNWEKFAFLPQIAKHQREAGDPTAAKATLDRLTTLVAKLKVYSSAEELVNFTGTEQPTTEKHDMSALVRSENEMRIAEERLALGDRDEACLLYRRAVKAIQSQKDLLKPLVLSRLSSKLAGADDQAGAHDVMEQALRAASEFTKPEDQERLMPYIVESMAEIGDLDGALKLARNLPKNGMIKALQMILESFAADDYQNPWIDLAGIKILIGADSMTVKDRAATIRSMPKISQAVHEIGDTLIQVRTLSIISNLQASAGDFNGARQTADSIPNIKRKDFPGPSDGFYDAIKPATLAINACLQAKAGDQAGASSGFRQALALSHAIENSAQRIVAEIVIIKKQAECGDTKGAKAVLRELIPYALGRSEPLRSRSLTMLVECQVKAGDLADAARIIGEIREYPGLEKVRALNILACWHDDAGNAATAKDLFSQALQYAEAKVPKNPPHLTGPVNPPQAIASRTFVDFEYEIDPKLIEFQKQMDVPFLRSRLGDTAEAIRRAKALPARNLALSSLAGALAREGNVTAAAELAKSLETQQERLTAFQVMAFAIRDREVRK